VLNLGHTFGHAFELLSDFRLRHGEGVSIGMVVAARLAHRMGYCSPALVTRIEATLKKVGLPVAFHGHDPEAIWNAMSSDKKKRGRRLRFVLPLDIGSVDLFDDIPKEIVLKILSADQQAE
jgi:3-dehydroquinate synthetase